MNLTQLLVPRSTLFGTRELDVPKGASKPYASPLTAGRLIHGHLGSSLVRSAEAALSDIDHSGRALICRHMYLSRLLADFTYDVFSSLLLGTVIEYELCVHDVVVKCGVQVHSPSSLFSMVLRSMGSVITP